MSFGADTDVDVQEEGRLVSLRYTRLTLVQKRILGGETSFQPMRMHSERNGGRSVVFTRHASQSLHASYIAKIFERLPSATGKITHGLRLQFAFTFTSASLNFFLYP